MIVFEEVVMPESRMRNHQGLHCHAVLLHAIHEAWIRIDDHLVGKTHLPPLVSPAIQKELLAVRPVSIIHRHAFCGVGIKHLFCGDCADMHRKSVKLQLLITDAGNFTRHFGKELGRPVRTGK